MYNMKTIAYHTKLKLMEGVCVCVCVCVCVQTEADKQTDSKTIIPAMYRCWRIEMK